MSTTVVASWLYATLADDATLSAAAPGGVHDGLAPEGTEHPFVSIDMQVPSDIYVVGSSRVGTRDLWLVKGVTDGPSYAPLIPVARRIDELLHAVSGIVADGEVWACVREREHRLAEVDDGVHYRHLGGEYRIWSTRQEE